MLEIRTYRPKKKGIRVDLYRRYKHIDPATHKVKFSYKQIGSFPLQDGYQKQSELLELLQPEDIVQLQNWLAENKFAEQFNVEPDHIEKFSIRTPQLFRGALTRLYMEGKRIGIEFIPHQVMLESLLQKAKLVQHKIDKINGFNCSILESIGINSQAVISEEKAKQLIDTESRSLFKALLNLDQSVGKTCSELEIAAQKYGKKKRIPPPQLKEWAGDNPNRNPEKRVKKWAYAIAIDVLHQHGMDPLSIIKPEKVAEYWAIQHQEKYTLEEAKKAFIAEFNVSKNNQKEVLAAITNIYKNINIV
jgi:hypothetical protein